MDAHRIDISPIIYIALMITIFMIAI